MTEVQVTTKTTGVWAVEIMTWDLMLWKMFVTLNLIILTHATIGVHPSVSQALTFRGSVFHPKPDVELI